MTCTRLSPVSRPVHHSIHRPTQRAGGSGHISIQSKHKGLQRHPPTKLTCILTFANDDASTTTSSAAAGTPVAPPLEPSSGTAATAVCSASPSAAAAGTMAAATSTGASSLLQLRGEAACCAGEVLVGTLVTRSTACGVRGCATTAPAAAVCWSDTAHDTFIEDGGASSTSEAQVGLHCRFSRAGVELGLHKSWRIWDRTAAGASRPIGKTCAGITKQPECQSRVP